MQQQPQAEHRWLERLVGEWTYESKCVMGPGQPPQTVIGRERVRSLGGLWVIAEGEMPGENGPAQSVMTLGFDPAVGHFTGTFVASVMTFLWVYRSGTLDEAAGALTLCAEGPSFTSEGTAQYEDIITLISDDHRTLTSRYRGAEGEWNQFMEAHYRRVG
jgi:hypothetical protein